MAAIEATEDSPAHDVADRPPAKRQRSQPLAGVLLFVPTRGLAHGGSVYGFWQRSFAALGGSVTQDAGITGVTHVLVPQPGGGAACLPPALRPGTASSGADLFHVTQQWVTDSLKRQQRQPERMYSASPITAPRRLPPPLASGGSGGTAASGRACAVSSYEAWLGTLWRPECAGMDLAELMLQGDYDPERCRAIGNEPIVQAMRELNKYEVALNGEWLKDVNGQPVPNHKSLTYARVAAAVRTCAYRLVAPVESDGLPYLSGSTAAEVNEILLTGTCDKLERFRRDESVRDSRGVLRASSAGAATRRAFKALPAVGAGTARQWWERGLRSYEDVEEAAAGRGPHGNPPLVLTPQQRFSIRHRADLLEGTSAADLAEMWHAVESALEAVTGVGGWQVQLVGGTRRKRRPAAAESPAQHGQVQGPGAALPTPPVSPSPRQVLPQRGRQEPPEPMLPSRPAPAAQPDDQRDAGRRCGGGGREACVPSPSGQLSESSATAAADAAGAPAASCADGTTPASAHQHHDADFMVSHPNYAWQDNLVLQLRDELIERRQLVPPEHGALCMTQHKRTADLEAQLLAELLGKEEGNDPHNNIAADRLDHIFGVFRTAAGRLRRMDVILAAQQELPFAVLGWIGSTMFTRLLRSYLGRRGMHLNNHGLYCLLDGRLARIPDEAPPLNRAGVGWWPPGWGPHSTQQAGSLPGSTASATDSSCNGDSAVCKGPSVVGRCEAAAEAAAEAGSAAAAAGRAAAAPRRVTSQQDIFDLLGLPYREPYQRDCP